MIDANKIEKATRDYFAKYNFFAKYDEDTCYDIEFAYKDGAKWAINEFLKNLWHPASEEPRKEAKFLYQSSHDSKFYYYVNKTDDILETYPNWSRYVRHVRVIQWLYVDDLFPKKGGEQ